MIEAHSGAEALRLAAAKRPLLVLVGADVLDIDGFDLCCRLKSAPQTALIPAIHIAPRGRAPREIPENLRENAYALLEAPVPPQALSAAANAMILAGEAERRRRHFDARLGEAEHRASEILERIADPVVAYDRQFRYIYVSRRTANGLGKTPEEMLGRSIFEIFPQIAGTGLEEASARAWAEGRPVVIERFSPFAGTWLENFIYPFEDGAVAQWHDISERKRAEEALRESEARLARAEEFSLMMPLHLSLEGAFLKVPPTFVRFLGFEHEDELLRKSFRDVTHPDDIQPEWDRISRLLSGEAKPFEMEKRFIRKDGSAVWGYMNCTVVTDSGGKPVHLLEYARDIDERKRAETVLRESETRALARLAEIEATYESSPVGLALLDTGLRFLRVNRRFAEMNGWPAEAHVGKTVADLNPQFEGAVREAMQRVLTTGEPLLNLEFTGATPAAPGIQRVWNEHWVPVRDERGQIISISVAVEDITGRKQATEELERRKRLYEALAENAPEAIVRFDPGLRHIYINNYGARLYRLEKSDILGKTFVELGYPPEKEASWRERLQQVFATGKQLTIDFESPGHKHFSSLLVPEFDAEEHVASVLAITRDITRLKRVEEELRQNRDLLAFAMENAGAGSFALDLATGQLEWSKELRKLHGVGPEEPVTFETWIEGILPEDRERVREEMIAARATGEGVTQFRIRRGGEIRWLEGRGRALRDEKGRPVKVVGVSIDITAQKRAEEALSGRERQLRELADGMPQLVWINDAAGHSIYVNRQWYEQTGFPADKALDLWPDLLHPEDRERCLDYWRRCLATGEVYQIEYRLQVPGGGYRWFLARAVPVHDTEGRIARWFGTCTDIDESKRAEERLRQAQKLESIGLLAGGIAHDFNNLLTGILGNASMIVDDVDPVSAERIREVISSAERAAHLTRQLLAYSGKGQFFARDLDLSQTVNEMSDLMQFSLPKSVDLSVHFQRRLPLVRMDPGQVQQVVMNLVINAGEAIGEGRPGRVTVSTSLAEVTEPFADATGQNIPAGRYVAIEVADTGPGMDRETLSKIFDPFFTTKFTGRGLGLAAVAGIVRSQDGAIIVESSPGRGATFRVLFRAAGRRAAEPGPRGTILVVDDEASVRAFICAVLRREGYRVLEAFDGREALAIFDREKEVIEGIVLDVVMPVMGANELIPLLKSRKPDIAILLTSGYSEAEARRLSAAYPGAAFIQKPYTARQILKALQQSIQR